MQSAPWSLEALVLDGDLAGLEVALRADTRYPQADLDAALWRAAGRGWLDMLRALIAAGADVNATMTHDDGLGWPLFGAVWNKETEALRYLLEMGADVNAADSHGQTPLHIAVDSEADGAIQTNAPTMPVAVTAMLLEHGADPGARDARGQTPLDIATEYRHEQAIALLEAALARRHDSERAVRWPVGIPGIAPRVEASDPAVPTVSAEDAVAYVHVTGDGGGWFVPVGPFSVEGVEFVTAGAWRTPWLAAGIAQPPQALLCVVKLAGRFMIHMPPRHRGPLRTWHRRKCVAFDAHTGNVLQRPVDPHMSVEPRVR